MLCQKNGFKRKINMLHEKDMECYGKNEWERKKRGYKIKKWGVVEKTRFKEKE